MCKKRRSRYSFEAVPFVAGDALLCVEEDYPTEKEVEFDLSRDALFCMRDDDGNIAGVISIDDDPNVECLTCWSKTMVPSAEVSRVGVYQAAHLLVAQEYRREEKQAVSADFCKKIWIFPAVCFILA